VIDITLVLISLEFYPQSVAVDGFVDCDCAGTVIHADTMLGLCLE
jgi:hypothetical protein